MNALTAAGFTPSQANVMSCIAMTESSGNPTAQNKSGSACGTFQVIKSTWESAAIGTSCSSFSSCTNASCNAEVAKSWCHRADIVVGPVPIVMQKLKRVLQSMDHKLYMNNKSIIIVIVLLLLGGLVLVLHFK